MGVAENRAIRRRMLLTFYEAYQTHPHLMLSPKEVMDAANVTYDELLRNIFYLEEHGLIECLKGFGTALFGAAKLTAHGVDVVEDEQRLSELFPVDEDSHARPRDELSELLERIRTDARNAPLGQEDIDTLLDELEFIRKSLERTRTPERMQKIETLFGWVCASFDGNESVLRDIRRLIELIRDE
jgi:hypothetical protein